MVAYLVPRRVPYRDVTARVALQACLRWGVTSVATALALVALALFASAAPAGAFVSTGVGTWVWQSPLPQGNDLNDIAFTDGEQGWAVGDAGTILRSTDGGLTWTSCRSGIGEDLHGIAAADSLSAWAVGEAGTVLTTGDGGVTWQVRTSGATEDLCAITVVAHRSLWAVGSGGTVLHSDDAGVTWERQTTGAATELHAVQFVDTATGWTSGAGGTVLHTHDGGVTWSAQDWSGSSDLPPDVVERIDLRTLSFVDANDGWMAGAVWRPHGYSRQVFVRTTDGGASWTPMPDTLPDHLTSAIAFVDRDHGWVAQQEWHDGWQVEIWRTGDGGASWSQSWGRMKFPDTFPVSLTVLPDGHAWIAGPGGRLSHTIDGRQWAAIATGSSTTLSDVAFADAATGWAVGHEMTYWEEPCLWHTDDGGETWETTVEDGVATGVLRAVACDGGDSICAVGRFLDDWADVVYSRDGGATFTAASADSPHGLSDVDFASADRVWAVGDRSGLFRSDDGGATWTESAAVAGAPLRAVDFIDEHQGWVAGDAGVVLHSDDGGTTWVPQASGTATTLYDVAFRDADHGWAVGDAGLVLRTTDGGTTWSPVPTGTGVRLTLVRATGHGVRVAGDRGTVLRSDESGATFVAERTGTHRDLLGLSTTGDRAWVVADSGTVLATAPAPHDVTPPVTRDDAPAAWANRDVTVTFTADDDASGVVTTEYRLDGAPWTTGTEVTVPAPADHSGDGIHEIVYRSTDAAGNVEPLRSCTVHIDTAAPSVQAPRTVLVRRGTPGAIVFTTRDPEPNGGQVTVQARGLRTGRRYAWTATVSVPVARLASLPLPADLARGVYRVWLSASDAAGNEADAPTLVRVVVR